MVVVVVVVVVVVEVAGQAGGIGRRPTYGIIYLPEVSIPKCLLELMYSPSVPRLS